MTRIILASNNAGKIKEVRQILDNPELEIVTMKEAGVDIDIEENGATFEENALIKARTVMEHTGCLTIADDSGLEVDAMNKEPGVYSARFMGYDTSYDIKNQAIIDKLKGLKGDDRSARFVCVIAAVLPDGTELVTRGTMEGIIAYHMDGENGFGYDPILYLPEFAKTSASLTDEQKNAISHRGKALRLMRDELAEYIKR